MMATERAGIRWGTTEIPYLIRRSARRGTVSVAVEPSGQVSVARHMGPAIDVFARVMGPPFRQGHGARSRVIGPWIARVMGQSIARVMGPPRELSDG